MSEREELLRDKLGLLGICNFYELRSPQAGLGNCFGEGDGRVSGCVRAR